MKKLYLLIIVLSCWFGNNSLQAQCSVNISTNPNTTRLNCSDTIITLKANATGLGKITYLWSTKETTASIKVKDSGNYSVTITAGNGCTSSSSIKITKDITIPDVSILAFPGAICKGSSSTLVAIGADSYKWIPGQSTDTGAAITVIPAATTNYIVTGTASNGCKGKDSFNLVVNPLPVAGISGGTSVCQDAAEPLITFKGSKGTAPYTFIFNINNGSSTQAVTTSGTDTLVTVSASTGDTGVLSYNLIAVTDANGCRQSQNDTVLITVLAAPTLTSPNDRIVCDSSVFNYRAKSSATILSWTRPAVAGVSNPAATRTGSAINETLDDTTSQPVPVNYIFTLSTGTGCVTTDALKLTVNPTPITDPVSDYTFCNGYLATIDSFKSNSPNVTFKWYNNKPGIGLTDSGTGNILPFIAKNTKPGVITATATVKITTGKTCPGPDTKFTIGVLPALVLTSPKSASICDSTEFIYTARSSFANTTFSWTRDSVKGISNPKKDNIPGSVINETLYNTTHEPVVVNYVFHLLTTGAECKTTDTLKLTVNPGPTINPVHDYIFCNGGLASLDSFKSSSPNAAFTWSNSNSGIGLTDSGIGNIFPFIAVNNSPDTIATGTVTVKITASSDNCPGPGSEFTIKIRPALVLTSAKTKSICNGDTVKYWAKSSVAGTQFGWLRLPDSNITPDPGTDTNNTERIREILHNKGQTPVVVNYVFYLSTIGTDCVATDTLKLTVNPPPKIDSIPDYFFCDGNVSSIPITGNIQNASITWELTNPVSIGLPANGTGNIPQFRATNIGNTAVVANLIANIQVGDNGECRGNPDSFNITVYPRPKLVSARNISTCDDSVFNYMAISSAANTIFSWTRPAVSGINNSGKDSIPGALIKDTLDNTKTSPKVVSYFFTLSTDSAKGCSYKDTLKVTVNPTPKLTHINDTVFCNNELVKAINFTGTPPDAAFAWTNDNINIGLTDTGFGNITGFIATNTISDAAITANIKVNITYGSQHCPGQPDSFIIKVNPSAATPYFTSLVPSIDTLKLCTGSNNISFNINAPVEGTDYRWTSSETDTNFVHIKDSLYANTVISFLKPGDFHIQATAINKENGSCVSSTPQVVKVSAPDGIMERTIFKKQPGNLLIYPDNSIGKYQWGYDSVIDMNKKVFSPSVPIAGQVYQFFIPDIKFLKGEELNEADYLYWVALTNGSCYTKVYYNGPYVGDNLQAIPLTGGTPQLRVIPNPNSGVFEIVLSGNIYGNINAKIYNATGRAVYRKSFSKLTQSVNEKFVTGNLPSGFYFIELYSSDLKKVVSRFLIQR